MPQRGTVFLSLADRNKTGGLAVARRFVELGFAIVATAGTAERLQAEGVPVEQVVAKVGEAVGTDAVDLIASGKVDLVVNTPRGRGPRADGMHIRRAAIVHGVPCLTTVAAALAAASGIAESATHEVGGPVAAGVPPRRPDATRRLMPRPSRPSPDRFGVAKPSASEGFATPKREVDTTVRLGSVELANPIVAASGTFGHGDEVARVCDPTRLGAVTVKSLAPYPWPGNPPPRLRTTASGMINSVGLEGPGVEHWVAQELPSLLARGARVIASVWGRTVDDFALAAKQLGPALDDLLAVEVNVSCPNVEDRARMFAHSTESTRAAIGAVVAEVGTKPVFAKLSPNTWEIADIAGAALDAGATGLTLVNTLLGLAIDADARVLALGGGGGGSVGPRDQTRRAPRRLRGDACAPGCAGDRHRGSREWARRGRDAARGGDGGRGRDDHVPRATRDGADPRRARRVVCGAGSDEGV